ncbi:putative tetraspanin-9 [Scophthalmus maximus]|uniref:Putative tetraspanin-9 n=1 Tax=Scophthalmus maximus TaxID=52904 RepID=A0A2U9BWU2_SCOMX|nr:putative tetraspanin-9 [Scophthalmus maximus]
MEKSSSEESAIHRSPSVDSRDSDFAQASTSGRPFGGRGFTAGAFYGSTGSRKNAPQGPAGAQADAGAGDKATNKPSSPKGSKYVVFYLDLSFVFLLEFKKCNMARGCLCCLKYMMFIFNLIFWGFYGGNLKRKVNRGQALQASPYMRSSSGPLQQLSPTIWLLFLTRD